MRKVTIGDLGDIYTGNTPSKKNVEFYDSEDIMFIKPDILDFDINTINESNEYVSERAREKARIIPKDSLLVSCIGNIGKLGINKKEAAFNQQINAIVHNEKIVSSRYLAYLIKYNQKKLEAIANAPVVPIINKTQFSNFELFIHENLETQNKIVEVLDKAQSLIDKKREQIELLDELVKSRFIEMFGDPVNNPKSFEILTIGDLTTDVKYGTSKSSSDGGKYPYLRMNNITYGGKLDLNDLKYIDIDDDELEKCIVKRGDVLFNRTNSIELIGKTCIFELEEPMVIAGYIIRVRLKNNILPVYLSTFLNSSYGKTLLRGIAKGAVNQANINAQELKSIKIHVPPIELQNEFAEFVKKVDSIRSKMEASLSELEDNFNSLMQKAFKGELF